MASETFARAMGPATKNTKTGLNSLGFDRAPEECRVVVAMSGGVDSSVTAVALKAEGYDVVGVTLQLYDHGAAIAKKGACCAGQDIMDARAVSDAVDIPHYVLDYEKRFQDEVMAPFAESYLAGETPIPCIVCNQTVKFRDLLDTAKELGGDCLATGHYVRRVMGPKGAQLHRGLDETRDQSYFLFTTTQEQLDFLRFPLGDLTKDETRALATRLGVRTADKPDSQDICFVPEGRYTTIIDRLRPDSAVPGEIVHVDGQVLGRHEGIAHYTIGQRRGLGIAVGEPLFVVKVEAATNRVIVGPRSALMSTQIALRDTNWLGEGTLEEALAAKKPVLVKVRSTRPPLAAYLQKSPEGGAMVVLENQEEAVAPGQACVFYDPASNGDRLLGGGWITAAHPVG